MTRTAPQATGQAPGKTIVYLFEIVFHDGSSEQIVRVCSASRPVTHDADGDGSAETYDAAGKLLKWSGERETEEARGQGVRIRLAGVDRSIMSTLLQNDFRGRRVRVWRAVLDQASGSVDEAYLVHRGLQLEDYEIREQVPEDSQDSVTAEIETRSVSRVSALQRSNAVRMNRRSHEAMLARAGVSGDDTGLFYVKQIAGKRIFWGSEQPDGATSGPEAGGSSGGGGGYAGGGGYGGENDGRERRGRFE